MGFTSTPINAEAYGASAPDMSRERLEANARGMTVDDWLADAREAHTHAQQTIALLRAKHSAIAELYGDAAEHAISGPVEGILDHLHDMRRSYERANDDRIRQHDRDQRFAEGALERVVELERHEIQVLDDLNELLDLVKKNYRHAGRTVPTLVADIDRRLNGEG